MNIAHTCTFNISTARGTEQIQRTITRKNKLTEKGIERVARRLFLEAGYSKSHLPRLAYFQTCQCNWECGADIH